MLDLAAAGIKFFVMSGLETNQARGLEFSPPRATAASTRKPDIPRPPRHTPLQSWALPAVV